MKPTLFLWTVLGPFLLISVVELGPRNDRRKENEACEQEGEVMMSFTEFMKTYNKTYENHEEQERRFKIFVENMAQAKKLQEEDMGTAEFGVTEFSDLTDEEFENFYLNPMLLRNFTPPPLQPVAETPSFTFEKHCDWRNRGAVTVVKNQGKCGSCWAFGVTSNVESQWFMRTGRLETLAEQELLDCDVRDKACKGGYPWTAFREIIRLGGMVRSHMYPYVAARRQCRYPRDRIAAWIHSFISIPGNEFFMAARVARHGPILAMINAKSMKVYKRGISRPRFHSCSPYHLNHVVPLIGYGTRSGIPYWIIKNSWGADWGEKGYFRLHRGSSACGIARYPMTALVF
nr:PREDICTED: cathepsin W [Latimeria chalumnae]|eukprot:XP_005998162.1 PREDICTED: cathepsin W [Latimeria chalumnae]